MSIVAIRKTIQNNKTLISRKDENKHVLYKYTKK